MNINSNRKIKNIPVIFICLGSSLPYFLMKWLTYLAGPIYKIFGKLTNPADLNTRLMSNQMRQRKLFNSHYTWAKNTKYP